MFSNMLVAEKRLLDACQKGEMLYLGDTRPIEKTIDNEIRGEFLRALILSNNKEIEENGKKYVLKINSQGINFQAAYICGIFDFSIQETNLPFGFLKSTFENQIFIMKSKIEEIDFSGSFCSSIEAFNLVCRKNIFLCNDFESKGEINFVNSEINGSLICNDSRFINENNYSLNLNNARILGNVILKGNFESIGEISFINSKINKSIYCSGKYINKNKISLNFNGSMIDGSIFLKEGFTSIGKVNFASAQIKKNLECDNGEFFNEQDNEITLNGNGAEVQGSVFLRNGFLSKGEVNFINLKIGGILDCSDGKFINKNGISLNCNGIKVEGTVFLRNGFLSEGEVNFIASKLASLDCSNSEFICGLENNISLICSASIIEGNVFLNNNFRSKGEINFISSQIGNILDCTNGKFINDGKISLNCNGSVVQKGVFLRNNFESIGEVNFIGAQIGNNFDCTNSKFINDGKISLNCNGSVVQKGVFLRNNFESIGEVNFIGSKIGSNFECTNGKFINEEGLSLNCFQMTVGGSVFLNDGFINVGTINFYYVQIKYLLSFLNLNKGCNLSLLSVKVNELQLIEKEEFGQLYLDGLEYNHISGINLDSKIFLQWLGKMPEFKPQPYKQLAKVLRNMGHNEDANNIMIKYNDELRKKDFLTCDRLFISILKWIYGKTAGYGYKPMKVLGTMFIVWFLCSLFYWKASSVAVFAPSNPLIFQYKDYKVKIADEGTAIGDFFNSKDYKCTDDTIECNNWTNSKLLDEEYTTFNPFMYSLDVILPIVDLQVEKDWGQYISSNNGTLNDVTLWLMWFEILFGWIYSLILVAILSGLAKNEKD